jgi:hypothetical protein
VVRNSARGISAEAPFTRNDAEPYKGEIVKKSFLRIFAFLAGLAAITIPAKAQEPDQLLVKVPFSFVAAGQTHFAGEYKVTRLRDEGARVLLLVNIENRADAVMLFPESQEAAHGKVQLAFATVDNQHFLSRVETANYTYNLSVPQADALLAAAPGKGMAPSSSSSGSN